MILILTKKGKGLGLGHFKRMNILNSFLNYQKIPTILAEIEEFDSKLLRDNKIVLLDLREVDNKTIFYILKERKIIISLDDIETSKPSLVSILSLPYEKTIGPSPNFEGIKYLILDPRLESINTSNDFDILITFGGEDPNNLTTLVIERFSDFLLSKKTCVFIGDLFTKKDEIIEVCKNKKIDVFDTTNSELYEIMSRSKVIITSFGITTYEALAMNKKVLLFNTSEYHHRIYEIGKNELGSEVVEIGFLSSKGPIILLKDINTIFDSTYNNSSQIKKININENLHRWKNIIERLISISHLDFESISLSKAISRSNNKTKFMFYDKEIDVVF